MRSEIEYQIILNGVVIGRFNNPADRTKAFEEYVKPKLKREDSFLLKAEAGK